MEYIVYIQLEGGNLRDYERLHLLMGAAGYKRSIEQEGNIWQLPPTTYSQTLDGEDVYTVRDKVLAVVAAVRTNPSVLVTSGEAAWQLTLLREAG